MNPDIRAYNDTQTAAHRAVCDLLADALDSHLEGAECKIWHAHPVWFLDGNPVAGYSRLKRGIRLMFWSGADFDEPGLEASTGKFRDASVYFNDVSEVNPDDLVRWIGKSADIQWDYKNVVKRKGRLERLK